MASNWRIRLEGESSSSSVGSRDNSLVLVAAFEEEEEEEGFKEEEDCLGVSVDDVLGLGMPKSISENVGRK